MTDKIVRSLKHRSPRRSHTEIATRAALPWHICTLQICPRSPIPACPPPPSRASTCAACLALPLMDRTPSKPRAALWMAGWLALMLVMAIAGRETTHELNVFQIMEVRSILSLFILYPLIRVNGGFAARKASRPLQHFGRNLIHYAAQLSWLFALTPIPLSHAVSIEFTRPIWAAILAASFLGERMAVWKITAIVLGGV